MAISDEHRRIAEKYNSIAEIFNEQLFSEFIEGIEPSKHNIVFKGVFFQCFRKDPSVGTSSPFIMVKKRGEEGFRGMIVESGNLAEFEGDLTEYSVSFDKVYQVGVIRHRKTIRYRGISEDMGNTYIGEWELEHDGDLAMSGPFILERYVNPLDN